MNDPFFVVAKNGFGRWVILRDDLHSLAWSGSDWVSITPCDLLPIYVQVCNFDSAEEAISFAEKIPEQYR